MPREYFAAYYSFIVANRGDLTIYMHPLGGNRLDDHAIHAFFLGEHYPLDLSVLLENEQPLQYPELGLGYSAPQ